MDGAAWLRDLGHERVACLVAHHSESRFEIGLRGRAAALAAYEREEGLVRDALVYCDRRHRFTEALANLPTGVEVHVLLACTHKVNPFALEKRPSASRILAVQGVLPMQPGPPSPHPGESATSTTRR